MVEVERILQEKDRLYLELRVVLERQPGPEVAQQITSYQRVGTHLPECGYTLTRGGYTLTGGGTHLPEGGAHLPEGGYTLTRGWVHTY